MRFDTMNTAENSGFFYKMVTPFVFFREVIEELKKVTWPSASDVTRLTILVLGISVIVGLYIGGLDLIFTKAIEALVK